MSRLIDADALVPDFLVTTPANNTPCKRYVSMEQIHNAPTIEPEITQEDIELYCRRRCLTVITDDLYNEMKMRWSAQPERLTDDDFETIRIHLNAYKEKLCNQRRWKEAEEYQRIIDRFMGFASAQPYIRGVIDESGRIKFIEQSERKPGKWIQISPAGIYECSECGKNVMTNDIDEYKWCHRCGCKMETEG